MFPIPVPVLPHVLPENLTLILERQGLYVGTDEDGNPVHEIISQEVKASVIESSSNAVDIENSGPNTTVFLVEGYLVNPKVPPDGFDLVPNNRLKAIYFDNALNKNRYGEFLIVPTVVPYGSVLAQHIGTWIVGKLILSGGAKTWQD
jgi:hypothetical protein